jgi:hypothetical protein
MIIKGRQTSTVKVLSGKVAPVELLWHESLAREAHHLPQVPRWSIKVVFRIGHVFEEVAANDKLEYLKIIPVSLRSGADGDGLGDGITYQTSKYPDVNLLIPQASKDDFRCTESISGYVTDCVKGYRLRFKMPDVDTVMSCRGQNIAHRCQNLKL